MNKRLLSLALLLAASRVHAAEKPQITVQEFTLGNGM